MEVLFGHPPFTIQVASSSSFVRDRTLASPPPPPPDDALDSPWSCFNSFRTYAAAKVPEDGIDYRSDSSSSIGVPDADESDDESISSTGEDREEEVRSKLNSGFASLGSLEESLPIKRGLSSHFSGKLKSFANLAEAKSVKDIVKPENSFNKRRRVLIASKLAQKSSFYTWPNPKSMPLLALRERDDGDGDGDGDEEEKKSNASYSSQDNEDEDEDEEPKGKIISNFHRRRLMSLKSRSFSLADLQQQHHDQQEEH